MARFGREAGMAARRRETAKCRRHLLVAKICLRQHRRRLPRAAAHQSKYALHRLLVSTDVSAAGHGDKDVLDGEA